MIFDLFKVLKGLVSLVWRLGVLLPLGVFLVSLGLLMKLFTELDRLHKRRKREQLLERARSVSLPPTPTTTRRKATTQDSPYPVRYVLVNGVARRTTYQKGLRTP